MMVGIKGVLSSQRIVNYRHGVSKRNEGGEIGSGVLFRHLDEQ